MRAVRGKLFIQAGLLEPEEKADPSAKDARGPGLLAAGGFAVSSFPSSRGLWNPVLVHRGQIPKLGEPEQG
jgi:hypothetical protein